MDESMHTATTLAGGPPLPRASKLTDAGAQQPTSTLPPASLRRRVVLPLTAASLVAIGAFSNDAGLPSYETYKALLFVHIAVALVSLGSTFAMPVLQPLAARSGIHTLRFALRFGEQLERKVITPGSMLIIASGLGLLFSDFTGYRESVPAWLIAAMAWVAVVAVVAQTVQGPTLRKALEILEATPDTGPMPSSLGPVAGRMRIVGQFLSFSTLGILFLMVWKPGA